MIAKHAIKTVAERHQVININQGIRDCVYDWGNENTLVFDNPDYDEAIIGVTHDGKAVYDYDEMVYCLMKAENMIEEDAMDFIDYNTIRSIPYAGEYAPIIIHVLFDKRED